MGLEQNSHLVLFSRFQVISKGISPHQHSARSDNAIHCVHQKLHRLRSDSFQRLKLGHATLGLSARLLGEANRFRVIVKPIEVMDVSIETVLSIGRGLFFLGHLRTIFGSTGVEIVQGAVRVTSPLGFAQPAEFVATFFASHVVAALIFLDVDLAIGTNFGVGEDPEHVL